MKSKIVVSLLLFFAVVIYPQVENVQLTHPVYTFLKEMKVKGILDFIKEDDPLLSRFEVKDLLELISSHQNDLSKTEKSILIKYQTEFSDIMDEENVSVLLNPTISFFDELSEAYSDKIKYLYAFQEEENNIYFEMLGHFYHGQKFNDGINNANLFDIGFRTRGTLFNHLGYNLTILKGGVSGNFDLAETIEPRLNSSFKWVEAIENIGNYEFTFGYLKYHTKPSENVDVSIQVGREHLTLGYGYGSKLVLSGDNPALDFVKFNLSWGNLHLTSLHGSTVGNFSFNRDERYTKYFAFNKAKFVIPNLLDIGIGESIIYSGRGIELGYLSPLAFYKFVEMSIQDRDNANLYMDIQTKFIPNVELQGTFFLDENILSNLTDFNRYQNKTAYQVGGFWYEPFGIEDASLIAEYTKIRPYVYTHFDPKNAYSAFDANLGHNIGPNADEILFSGSYNLNEKNRFILKYRYIRKGENVYDINGNLVRNVGSDINLSHGESPVSDVAYFLDGERYNTSIINLTWWTEPIRDFIFELTYNFGISKNISTGSKEHINYFRLIFTLEY